MSPLFQFDSHHRGAESGSTAIAASSARNGTTAASGSWEPRKWVSKRARYSGSPGLALILLGNQAPDARCGERRYAGPVRMIEAILDPDQLEPVKTRSA